ncbi:MAG: undecaprenyl-phosphate glucose phosphotransferase [Candidatus Aminicenantaceae bacterium]
MIRKDHTHLIGIYLLSDIIAISFSFFYSYFFRFYSFIYIHPERGIPPFISYVAVFPLFLVAHLVIFYFQGFYKTRLKRTKLDDFISIFLNTIFTFLVIIAILSYLNSYSQGAAPLFQISFKLSHGFLAIYFIAAVFMIAFLRTQISFFMRRRFARGLDLHNVLIIGAGETGKSAAQKFSQYKDLGFFVKGFLDDEKKEGTAIDIDGGIKVLGPLSKLKSILNTENISDVFIALDLHHYPKILEILKVVEKFMVNVRLIPDLFQLLTLKAGIQDLDGFPVISIDEVSISGIKALVKRVIDIGISFLLLVLLSPLLLIIAFLIKATSKGPVLYRQRRVGLDGRKFILHKFRTMIQDAEMSTGPVMSKPGDPRVTRVGKYLRKFSIDEIPQLINVLRGEMSLIGPRPERPVFVKDFSEKIPKYMLRHKVKSGITGWAQVHGLRQDTPIDKRLEYDFYYIQNWSLALDLRIVWKTLKKGFIDKHIRL